MKYLITFLVLFAGLNLHAAELEQIAKPTSTKVAAAYRTWEKIYTPDLCYPDAIAFKVTSDKKVNPKTIVLAAAKSVSKDVKSLTAFRKLENKQDIYKTAENVLRDIGMMKDDRFSEQLVRIAQKADVREIYEVATTNGKTATELTGTILAIYDLENSELVLLTTGDAFGPSGCSE